MGNRTGEEQEQQGEDDANDDNGEHEYQPMEEATEDDQKGNFYKV